MVKVARIDKQRVVDGIKAEVARELAVITASAKAAHEAATHEDAKPENEYDTRGLEASYLARGQAQRAAQLEAELAGLSALVLAPLSSGDPISVGALVELESERGRQLCFLSPAGAGIEVEVGQVAVTVVTPRSPLGAALLGKTEGDGFELAAKGGTRDYEILTVA